MNYLISIYGFVLTAIIAASFSNDNAAYLNFFIFLIGQVLTFLPMGLRKDDSYFTYGASFGVAFTTLIYAIWELYWYKGSNSMPFFVYFFFVLPVLLISILIAYKILDIKKSQQKIYSFFVPLVCTIPIGIHFAFFASRH